MTMGKILLVEDEDLLRRLIREILESRGYEVVLASHGEEALEFARNSTEPLTLMVTDVVMPHMNGPDLMVQIRLIHPELKVIFISGYTGNSNDTIQLALKQPGVAFLQKPFRLHALIGLVESLVGSKVD